MDRTAELIAKTRHLLPDLEELEEVLAEEPETIISRAFPVAESELRARGMLSRGIVPMEFNELDVATERERMRIVGAARRAVSKIRARGEDAVLEPDEANSYEAIVWMVGRPAILIQNGRFFPPPRGWETLEEVRASIEKTCQSVGRIEVSGHPLLDWIGTGFLVAEDVVMTNRHVAKEFCRLGESGHWVFELGMESRIDYVEELGALESAEYALTEVIGIHEEFDLALFRASHHSVQGEGPPEPLTIATEVPGAREGRKVYVVGYPEWDGRRNDPEVMRRIFNDVYGVKRLQPGEMREVFGDRPLFYHDCSTLGGNSGSCVVDLETNQVIGLHFSGRYLEANKAVALWALRNDPLIRQASVHFD